MWRYNLLNINVEINTSNYSFVYKDNTNSASETNCIGLITQKINNGNSEHMFSINLVNSSTKYQTIDNIKIPFNINNFVVN